jgi:hypothetical protein
MDWETLTADVTARHPDIRVSAMFGMPCLKKANGKVAAGLWKDGGITVKLVDPTAREAALALAGTSLFDPGMGRAMKEWVHVPSTHADRWSDLVEQALG